MTIGSRIREGRKYVGLSQTELANKINISKQTLYKYENNIVTNIPSNKIEELAQVLNVSPCYLMGWEEKSSIKEAKQPKIMHYYDQLNDIGKHEAEKRVLELTYIDKYTSSSQLRAAHNNFADNDEEIEKIRRDFDKF